MDMKGDTRSFDIVKKRVIEKQENPFGLTELEDKVVRRSLPAFLKSAVKYSGDLDCSLIDYRGYSACFEVPYKRERECDSYLWRMYHYLANFDTTVFTRSDGAREEMSEILQEIKEYIPTEQFNDAVIAVSSTFADVINKFNSSATNLRKGNLDSRYVQGLIDSERLPESDTYSKEQIEYCARIISDSMLETQSARATLVADLAREKEMND